MATMITKRLKGATLIETIVALVIILVIFGIATTILVQTTLSTSSVRKLQAAQLATAYLYQTNEEKAFFDEEIAQEGYMLKRVVVNYKESRRVLKITVTVYDGNNQLIEQQHRLFASN